MEQPAVAMNSVASIALSGLTAASSRLSAAAHNIANAQTPGLRRQLVQQAANPEGGVLASIGHAAASGDALIEDVVAQMSATYAFKANVLTLKTQDRMLGHLLDLRA
jgi:flagellar hook protein FlgE